MVDERHIMGCNYRKMGEWKEREVRSEMRRGRMENGGEIEEEEDKMRGEIDR